MSLPTRNPVAFIGAVNNSGFPNTGESPQCRGGMITATVYSGGALSPGSGFLPTGAAKTADHILLCPTPGRLNNVFLHGGLVLSLSGVRLDFYDAASVTASGPATNVPTTRLLTSFYVPGGLSGQFNTAGMQVVDMPFTSGLCVCATSGTPGWTASWTPETNRNNP